MSENKNEVPSEDFFDSDHFLVSSKLNGRRGTIIAADARRHNYNGKTDDATGVFLTVKLAEHNPDEKPTVTNIYGAGDLFPGLSRTEKAPSGPFLVGKGINKTSNVALLLSELKTAGFPVAELNKRGFDALVGADITWKAYEKGRGKDAKAYDVPAEYHGQVEVSETGETSEASAAGAGGSGSSASNDELIKAATDALKAALEEAPNKEIQKSQLSIQVGKRLPKELDRGKVLSIFIKDDVLASIPGVTYDKKTVKLNEEAKGAEVQG